ncbi:hypothetical protein HY621_02760 [Candidatus Uhrbacteria bacterium]|nr:hypothetical protein [Candidatus Uhrbacteria bacterium]
MRRRTFFVFNIITIMSLVVSLALPPSALAQFAPPPGGGGGSPPPGGGSPPPSGGSFVPPPSGGGTAPSGNFSGPPPGGDLGGSHPGGQSNLGGTPPSGGQSNLGGTPPGGQQGGLDGQMPGGNLGGTPPSGGLGGNPPSGQQGQQPGGLSGQTPGGQSNLGGTPPTGGQQGQQGQLGQGSQKPGQQGQSGQLGKPGEGGQFPGQGATQGQFPGGGATDSKFPGQGGQTGSIGTTPGGQQQGGQLGKPGETGQFPGGSAAEGKFPGQGATQGEFPGGPGGSQGQTGKPGETGQFPGQGSTEGQFPGKGAGQSAFSQFKLEPCAEGQSSTREQPCIFRPKVEVKQDFAHTLEGEKTRDLGQNVLGSLGQLERIKGVDNAQRQAFAERGDKLQELQKKALSGDQDAKAQFEAEAKSFQSDVAQAVPTTKLVDSFLKDFSDQSKSAKSFFGGPQQQGQFPGQGTTQGKFPGQGATEGKFPGGAQAQKGGTQGATPFPSFDQGFQFAADAQIGQKYAQKAKTACATDQASEECTGFINKMTQYNKSDEIKFQQGNFKDLSESQITANLEKNQAKGELLTSGFQKLQESFGFKPPEKDKKLVSSFSSSLGKSLEGHEQGNQAGFEKGAKELGTFNSQLSERFSWFAQGAPPPSFQINEEMQRTQANLSFSSKALELASKWKVKAPTSLAKTTEDATKLVSAVQTGTELNDTSLLAPAFDYMQQSGDSMETDMGKIFQDVGKKQFGQHLDTQRGEAGGVFKAMQGFSSQIPKAFQKTWNEGLKQAQASLTTASKADKKGDAQAEEEGLSQSFAAGANLKRLAEKFNVDLPEEVDSFFEKPEVPGLQDKFDDDTKVGEAASAVLGKLPPGAVFAAQKMFAQMDPATLSLMAQAHNENPDALQEVVQRGAWLPEKAQVAVLKGQIEVQDVVNKVEEEIASIEEDLEVELSPALKQKVEEKLADLSDDLLPEGSNAAAQELLGAVRIQLAEVEDPIEAEAYLETLVANVDPLLESADAEKFELGYVPAKNISEDNPLYDDGMALKEGGDLKPLTGKDGKINYTKNISRNEYKNFFNEVVDKKIAPPKGRGTPKKGDVLKAGLAAFVGSDVPKDPNELVGLAETFGVENIKPEDLGKPATIGDCIEIFGSFKQETPTLVTATK